MVLKRFVGFRNNIRLHLSPDYLLVIDKRNAPFHVLYYNNAAKKIFTQIDGKTTIKDILFEVYGNEWEGKKDYFQRFFDEEQKKKILRFSEDKINDQNIEKTGSENYYVPIHLSFEMTTQCNFNCVYCYNEFHKEDKELSVNEIIEVLEKWTQYGLIGLELTGGEPLARSDFWEILKRLPDEISNISLLTNGSLLSEDHIKKIVNYNKIKWISVSLDALDETVFEKLTGSKGLLEKVKQNCQTIIKNGLKLRITSVVSKINYQQLPKIAEFAHGIGAHAFSFSPVTPFGKGQQLAWNWNDESSFREYVDMEMGIKARYPDLVRSIKKDEMDEVIDFMKNCGVPHKNITMDPNGNLKVCNLLSDKYHAFLGNIKERSLVSIFRSQQYEFLSRIKAPGQFEECSRCRFYTYCYNCIARALSVFMKEKKLCHWAQESSIKEIFPLFSEYSKIDYF